MFPNNKIHYFINDAGYICSTQNTRISYSCPNNATYKKQLEKLIAINMLMNVAKYLNKNWQPDWNDRSDKKWSIKIDNNDDKILADYCDYQYGDIYFKSKELVEQAITILGENTIRVALCTDY